MGCVSIVLNSHDQSERSINDHISHLPPLYIEQSTDMCSHPYDVVVDDWNS